MQAEVLLLIFFELLLEVVDKDGETACSARAEQQLRWASGRLAKN
jgi:hypothetical protein